MKTAILSGAALVLTLGACTEPTGPRTQTGAVIGGTIGGLIGASSSDDKLVKGVLGAGLGAAIGGAIGQRLDQQAQDLRRDLDSDIGVVNTGSELRVTMPQDLLFAVDSTSLRPDLQSDLRALARNLNEYPDTRIFVIGHTDSTGDDGYNYDLSERRAAVVGSVLRNSGVDGFRIQTSGRGETQPVASNNTASGRAQNRRVEIIIRPNT